MHFLCLILSFSSLFSVFFVEDVALENPLKSELIKCHKARYMNYVFSSLMKMLFKFVVVCFLSSRNYLCNESSRANKWRVKSKTPKVPFLNAFKNT